LGWPLPDIGAEPDGCITLKWSQGPRWLISISIGAEQDLHYVALFGDHNICGLTEFSGKISVNLLQLIETAWSKQ
jgi:hypothetical protein